MSAEEQLDRIAIWLGLDAEERWALIRAGVRPSTVTIDAVLTVRCAVRDVFVPEMIEVQ
jgi:hypothetical protein